MKILNLILTITFTIITFNTIVGTCLAQKKTNSFDNRTIRFGTLPVLQALPLFVAAEKQYFDQHNITVELISFNSAMERDVALAAEEINGFFGDMMALIMLNSNGIPIKTVATNFGMKSSQRMFAILAAPNSSHQSIKELADKGIAVSSNTIIEYITGKILNFQTKPIDTFNLIEVKNIPIRLQMLLSNQVPAATLPEPLATLAEMKGARILADDTGQKISSTILTFNKDFLTQHPQAVKNFNTAINHAVEFTNQNPEAVRPIMNRYCRIPKLLQKSFPVPRFPLLSLPDKERMKDVCIWLRQKGLIKKELNYPDLVSDGYLP